VLGEKKNMNLPGCTIDLPTLTEEDEKDIVEFGLKKGIDIVAASFIRKASDVKYVRDVLGPQGSHVKIIAKIENSEGLKNFDQILDEADGIMVARGDLGMELQPEKLFLA
jgi:pyruvate kinase